MTAVRRALSRSGVEEGDVETTNFSIDVAGESVGGVWKQVGFRVSNSIKIVIRDMDAAGGQVVDAAIVAGGDAVRVDGIRFEIDHPEQYAAALRTAAAEDARDRANQIAGAVGEQLGGLISATDRSGGARAPRMMMMRAEMADAQPTTPISAGDLEIRAEVDAVFAIR